MACSQASIDPPVNAPFRYAIVGAGAATRQLHLPVFGHRPDALALVAACDPSPAARAALAAEMPGLQPFASHQEMIREAAFDAAIVTLPHHLHFSVARDFVEAGIPVIVEKPAVCSLEELRTLRDLAERKRVPVAAGQNRRFNREAAWIRDWVRATPENFGALRTFDLQAWQNIHAYTGGPERTHWLLDKKLAGGGVVISLAIHQLDFLRFAFGIDYTEVVARGRFDPPFRHGAESCASVLLTSNTGASGTLHAQYTAARVPYCESLKAFGERGAVVQLVDRPFSGEYDGTYYYATDRGDARVWADQFHGFDKVDPALVAGLDAHTFTNQAVAFADCVRSGRAPANSLRENFNTLATIFAIRDSLAAGGRPVKVATE